MKSIMGAFMMALLFLLSGSADALAERINFSFEPFLRSYYREALLGQINKTLHPDLKAIEFILEEERKTNPAAQQVRPEDFMDTRFLDKLRKEGY